MAKILTIEDEANLRLSISRSLTRGGHEVAEAGSLDDAWAATRDSDFDAVITDVNLAGRNGLELVRGLREEGFDGAIIVITAFGTVENAVAAMKDGADHYIQKPVSLEELTLIVSRALEERKVRRRLRLYERLERAQGEAQGIIGKDKAWLSTLALCERLAEIPSPAGGDGPVALPTILLLGETGTGKGVLARHLHEAGSRKTARAGQVAQAPFVHVNCVALPATLIESELFGHEKGAFTDAKAARTGLFEMAEGGTIFLDEIGDMPLDLQSKLLLVVERGVFRRVGGTRERRVNARVVAATNQDLERQVELGKFRRDLYYRLNAFTIRVPPLRDRGEDAIVLAQALLTRFAREQGRAGLRFSDASLDAIRRHSWPGNVRELANAVQRAATLAAGEVVQPHDLGVTPAPVPPSLSGATAASGHTLGPDGRPTLTFDFDRGVHTFEEVERALIVQALERARGNVSKAAKLIGMNRGSLRYRIERYGLEQHVQELMNQ